MSEAETSRLSFGGDKPLAPTKGLFPPKEYFETQDEDITPMSNLDNAELSPEVNTDVTPEETVEVADTPATEPVKPAAFDVAGGTAAPSDGPSIDELRAQQDKLNAEIAAKLENEQGAVIAQVVEVVNTYKIPVAKLVEALGGWPKKPRKGSPAKAKYKDPATGATWTGRGREPVWIRDKNREDFLIV